MRHKGTKDEKTERGRGQRRGRSFCEGINHLKKEGGGLKIFKIKQETNRSKKIVFDVRTSIASKTPCFHLFFFFFPLLAVEVKPGLLFRCEIQKVQIKTNRKTDKKKKTTVHRRHGINM